MNDEEQLDLKNPWVAGTLAFLIPGAGHLYQGRTFKGVVYLVCILGSFFYGMALGDWRVVAATQESAQPGRKERNFYYLGQFPAGLVTLPALVQSQRYFDADNREVHKLDRSLAKEPFSGVVSLTDQGERPVEQVVNGTISLEPVATPNGPEVKGTFQGVDSEGQAVEFPLGGTVHLGPAVAASSRRSLVCDIPQTDHPQGYRGQLVGSIPRPFFDYFEVPLSSEIENEIHATLGRYYELALVFTWIAGLLNILAIWDAVEGPAYGLTDAPRDQEETPATEAAPASEASATESRTASL